MSVTSSFEVGRLFMHKRFIEYTSTLAGVVRAYIVQLNLKDERQLGAPYVVTSPKGSSDVCPGK